MKWLPGRGAARINARPVKQNRTWPNATQHYRATKNSIGLHGYLLRCYRHFGPTALKPQGLAAINGTSINILAELVRDPRLRLAAAVDGSVDRQRPTSGRRTTVTLSAITRISPTSVTTPSLCNGTGLRPPRTRPRQRADIPLAEPMTTSRPAGVPASPPLTTPSPPSGSAHRTAWSPWLGADRPVTIFSSLRRCAGHLRVPPPPTAAASSPAAQLAMSPSAALRMAAGSTRSVAPPA